MTNNLFDNQNEGIVDEQLLNRAMQLLRKLKKEGKQPLPSDYFQQKLGINKIQLSSLIEELQHLGILSPSQTQQNLTIDTPVDDNTKKEQNNDIILEDTNTQQNNDVKIEKKQDFNAEIIKEQREEKVLEKYQKKVKGKTMYSRYLNEIEQFINFKQEKKMGLFLKAKRIEKNLSLKEVAQSTKIPMICLQKIETQKFSYFNSQLNLINYIGLLDREYKCDLSSFFSNIAESINSSCDNCNIVHKSNDFEGLNNLIYKKKKYNLSKLFNLYIIPLLIGVLLYCMIFSEEVIVVDLGNIDFNSLLEEKELPIIKLFVPE